MQGWGTIVVPPAVSSKKNNIWTSWSVRCGALGDRHNGSIGAVLSQDQPGAEPMVSGFSRTCINEGEIGSQKKIARPLRGQDT